MNNMAYEKEMMEKVHQLYPISYTENWEDKHNAFIKGVQWMYENSEEPELKEEISQLEDKISDLEYDIDEKDDEIQKLNKQLNEL